MASELKVREIQKSTHSQTAVDAILKKADQRLIVVPASIPEAMKDIHIRRDSEKTNALEEATKTITEPYFYLFSEIIDLAPSRKKVDLQRRDNGERTADRRDNSHTTEVNYILTKTGKVLKSASVKLGGNQIGDNEKPELKMTFNSHDMTDLELSFPTHNRSVLQELTHGSFLGEFLEEQFPSDMVESIEQKTIGRSAHDRSKIKVVLGKNLEVVLDSHHTKSKFTWEPRQITFRRDMANSLLDKGEQTAWRLEQEQFLELVSNMLALVPEEPIEVAELGKTVTELKLKQSPQPASFNELLDTVDKLHLSPDQQFGAMLRIMEQDSHRIYVESGFLEEIEIPQAPDKKTQVFLQDQVALIKEKYDKFKRYTVQTAAVFSGLFLSGDVLMRLADNGHAYPIETHAFEIAGIPLVGLIAGSIIKDAYYEYKKDVGKIKNGPESEAKNE